MRPILFIIIISSFCLAQESDTLKDTTNSDTSLLTESTIDPVPFGLETGYKGFAWGTASGTDIISSFAPLSNIDSSSANRLFVGKLGTDSVMVTYAFADSGFWKVEIDFVVQQDNLDSQISDFRRLEKNISAVYGPPKSINQKESGVSASYSNNLDQRFSRAIYRSIWTAAPAVIELYLNGVVLLPATELPVFSGNFSILKLVYYNPDFMHSSQPTPVPEKIPSIFDIY